MGSIPLYLTPPIPLTLSGNNVDNNCSNSDSVRSDRNNSIFVNINIPGIQLSNYKQFKYFVNDFLIPMSFTSINAIRSNNIDNTNNIAGKDMINKDTLISCYRHIVNITRYCNNDHIRDMRWYKLGSSICNTLIFANNKNNVNSRISITSDDVVIGYDNDVKVSFDKVNNNAKYLLLDIPKLRIRNPYVNDNNYNIMQLYTDLLQHELSIWFSNFKKALNIDMTDALLHAFYG